MFRRVLTTAVAAVALVGVTTVPAQADPNPPYTPTTVEVNGVTVGVFVSGLQISATCEAHVTGLVAATVIEECQIYENGWGTGNHPGAAPGNAAVSTFVQRVTTLDFQLCFTAFTIPLHNPNVRYPVSACAGDILPGGVTTGGGRETY